jgi:short subunit dehydrogenase-like uncharacterized protein
VPANPTAAPPADLLSEIEGLTPWPTKPWTNNVSNTARAHDLVVWGATGVAGGLVAEQLTERYSADDLSLAVGGRDEERLQALATELKLATDGWDEIPVVVGDATDQSSLRDVARSTDVVCTTVGPYAEYGTGLVEACIDAGTDYCDLTGEVTWVREMIDRYHDAAESAGVRIVHSCGFDSVPADLGTLLVQSYATAEFGASCDLVRIYLDGADGVVSGGTLASGLQMFDAAATDPVARESLQNPYSLAPAGERSGVDPGAQRTPKRDALRGGWTAPSPMASVNERIVRRSNALRGYPWGREFQCTEVIPTGGGVGGAAVASTVTAGLGVGVGALALPPARAILRRFAVPALSDGPTEEQVESGHFNVRVLGRGTATDGPFVVEAEVAADRDPGYGATAKLLGESGMSLVLDEVDSPVDGGVLTPASGIGAPLADRLRDAGLTVEVGEYGGEDRPPAFYRGL